ncbi:hypothetical protein PF005_g8265 [Phytophthora fragariae]|uniref:Transcription factor CBF/NF-Y/archaeal histone domain-containing protein n=1 Tax=Phytophthora fragariae TaxID=53985 RepID=A0A6A3U9I7_9STRA|nr:hypothetical protein PF007_g8737 [Phytophthora fragariae]KAE9147587.1 hypothetical protein PF006_g7737 [Phytophthora fragariae]KAE9218455.1 hypothetical protein PF005_g8265 [Phytophthora fragariae]KAE9240722.1 hypothetical protein PF002_g9623 [Phytophthora fragariae]
MAQPAAAGKATAPAAPASEPSPSTPSTTAHDEAKTPASLPVPVPPSNSQQKPQNSGDQTTQPSTSSSSELSAAPAVAAATASGQSSDLKKKQQEEYTQRLNQLQNGSCGSNTAADAADTASTGTPASAASTPSTEAKTSENPASSNAKTAAEAVPAGAAMDRALRAQDEARRLQFALAQQQVQQYQAMTKQLEAQSGIAMTPCSTIGGAGSSVAGLAKTSEDLQKLRQEQLARLQQNVQRQAAMAAQAVQKRSNEEWLRSKLLLEQEHLRLVRMQEQQVKQAGKGNTVTTATATSIADSLLAQQQQVIRQQQLLRDMLQKQQKQQQAQLQLQMQLQKTGDKTVAKPVAASTAAESQEKAYTTATTTAAYYANKRRLRTSFDMDLEALAKACIRVANSRTDCEMRQALDKMTSWLTRCTELQLLEIAQRDYRDSLAHRRPLLVQQDRWPLDLQVKSEHVTQKIVQMLGAFLLREKTKTAQQQAAAKAAAAASSAVAIAAAASSAVPTTVAPAVRIPEKRDTAEIELEYAEVKALLQAKQVETNQKAKAKRDAAKMEAAKAVTVDPTTAAMLAATYKRPLQVDIPGSVKKPRTDSYAMPTTSYRPPATSVPAISPRVAQKFYDLDLTTRTCTDSEDKMYLPPKIISKIMYRALPGAHDEEDPAGSSAGVVIKREEQTKHKTAAPAVSPSHSVHDQESSSSQDTLSISDDAVTFMQECVTEFLLYFTSEARDRSVMENRRTKKGVGLSISGENVVEGMENLGFTSYARVLAGYNEKVKASQDAAARKKMERKRLVQQKALEQARAAAAATIAANAAKMAAAGRTAASPHPYMRIASPLARPGAGTNVATSSRPLASTSVATAAVTSTAKPAPVTSTTPKASAPAAPTSTTK